MRSSLALLYIFLVGLIWGLTFPVIKITLAYISPLGLIFLRFLLASAFLFFIFRKKIKALTFDIFKAGAFIAIFLFLGHLFQTLGLEYTSASHSGFITGMYVVFTPIFASFLLGERFTPQIFAAIALSLIGLYLLSGFHGMPNIGDIITLFCALSYALQVVFVAKYSRIYDPTLITLVELAFVTLLSSAGWSMEGFFLRPSLLLALGITFIGFIATGLAILMQAHAQKFVPASQAAIIFTGEPVFAVIFSHFILGEILDIPGAIGASLILLGILLAALYRSHP